MQVVAHGAVKGMEAEQGSGPPPSGHNMAQPFVLAFAHDAQAAVGPVGERRAERTWASNTRSIPTPRLAPLHLREAHLRFDSRDRRVHASRDV
jgi:hypothetical protein